MGDSGVLDTLFLDRDGTINVKAADGDYVTRPEDLRLLPGAAHAIARANHADVRVVVVTNQRGVALGRMTSADLDAVHGRLRELLAAEGAHIDDILACEHDRDVCRCRKPAPGLIELAVARHRGVDLSRSALIGDAESDVQLGLGLGIRTVRVGPAAAVDGSAGRPGVHTAPDLRSAVAWLLPDDHG